MTSPASHCGFLILCLQVINVESKKWQEGGNNNYKDYEGGDGDEVEGGGGDGDIDQPRVIIK